jgi:DNA-binding protein H-NS
MATLNLKSMDVGALTTLRGKIDGELAERRAELQAQIEKLGQAVNGRGASDGRGRKTNGLAHALKGRKVAPKFRSKKDPKLTWAGRGATPRWMRDEMKAGKLKKDAFLIH